MALEYPGEEDWGEGEGEEYERLYADELELLQEQERESVINHNDSNPVRRSLNFASPPSDKQSKTNTTDSCNICTNGSLSQGVTTLQPTQESVSTDDATNKRTAEDLFGDIDDINFDEIELPSKRLKPNSEEDADLALIEKILEGRKIKEAFKGPGLMQRKERIGSYNAKENLSSNIPRWPFLPVSGSSGERVYVRFHSEEYVEAELADVTGCGAVLQDHLHDTYSKVWEEARAILDRKLESEKTVDRERGQSQVLEDLSALQQQAGLDDDSQLWVERYRPRSYLELLSDEPTNRAVLHWLKLWDQIVFNREVKTKDCHSETRFNKRAGKFEPGKFGHGKWQGKKAEEEPELDDHGRPRYKMALLCGPPGAGKTTLAHLIARHAGYRPLEVNASDDRSVEAFRTALENATRMQALVDQDRRPNCLILDEIDGAPLPTVEFLVKFCSGAADKPAGKKPKKSQHTLKRPIICICNDPWAPALRPLRGVARVVQFPPPSAVRLAARLAEVAAVQGLQADPAALAALAERAAGDVRAALAILYFFKAKEKQLRLADVLKLNVGQKDTCKGLMQVLRDVLYAPPRAGPDARDSTRFHVILNTVASAGDYDRLASGMFENYLTQRIDGRLLRAVCALDWFRSFDLLQSYIQRTQNYALYPHLPLAFVRFHYLLASSQRQFIKFPTQGHEKYVQQQRSAAVVSAMERGVAPQLRPHCSRLALTLDVLPLLPHLITPQLNSANMQLYSERERSDTASVVRAMCDYGLTYVQQRSPDGVYQYTLDPDINIVAFFNGGTVRTLPYAVKQTLAREVQIELMRRAEVKVQGGTDRHEKRPVKAAEPAPLQQTSSETLPNHLQRLQPRMIDTAPVTHKDFFGRVVTDTTARAGSNDIDSRKDPIGSSGVFYHYQEGFNNAVRRSVKIQDLM